MNCPKCQSTQIIKHGHTHYGKPRFRCQNCGRQFVENVTRQLQLISQFTLVEETEAIFPQWLDLVTRYQIKGKRTHDARLMAMAIASSITYILTFNPKDFTKIKEITIVHPDDIESTT